MDEYVGKLAKRIKGQNTVGNGTMIIAEYVSPTAVMIGGELFSHNVFRNPQCILESGDTVLTAQIGTSLYVICKVV